MINEFFPRQVNFLLSSFPLPSLFLLSFFREFSPVQEIPVNLYGFEKGFTRKEIRMELGRREDYEGGFRAMEISRRLGVYF